MKKTTCQDLKGACDETIIGSTPEEMGQNSRFHVMKMVEKGDQSHIDAIEAMKALTQ